METKIYLKVLKLFESKGTHFTTEDLAKELGTSKRSIYTYFKSKDDMIEKTIDYVFSDIMQADADILKSNELSLVDKIQYNILTIPDAYNIGAIIQHIDDLERYYPKLWKKVNNYLDTIWDTSIKLVVQGIQEGEIEEVDTNILKLLLKESLKKLLDYRYMVSNNCSFESGLKAINQIILYGIIKR